MNQLAAQRVEYQLVVKERADFRGGVDEVFHKFWGSGNNVRDFQWKTMEAVHLKDGCAVICVPTGNGKSMPSQLLALMGLRHILVVAPTRSLMMDQTAQFRSILRRAGMSKRRSECAVYNLSDPLSSVVGMTKAKALMGIIRTHMIQSNSSHVHPSSFRFPRAPEGASESLRRVTHWTNRLGPRD
jgi:hypothetical protein